MHAFDTFVDNETAAATSAATTYLGPQERAILERANKQKKEKEEAQQKRMEEQRNYETRLHSEKQKTELDVAYTQRRQTEIFTAIGLGSESDSDVRRRNPHTPTSSSLLTALDDETDKRSLLHTRPAATRNERAPWNILFRNILCAIILRIADVISKFEKAEHSVEGGGRTWQSHLANKHGFKSPAKAWGERTKLSVTSNWPAILRCFYIISFIIITLFFLSHLLYSSEDYQRSLHVSTLTKFIPKEQDKLRILHAKATMLADEQIKSGLVGDYPLELAKKRLLHLHQTHPNDGHLCLTAKHINLTWAMISIQDENNVVSFVFNPVSENFHPLSSEYRVYNETSDFFATTIVIPVKRPVAAWVTWTNSDGVVERDIIRNERLQCIMHAWEILDGKHAARFGFVVK